MIAYLCTPNKNVNFQQIDHINTYCLSLTLEVARISRSEHGLILKVDMDDNDVVSAVLGCMHGSTNAVKVLLLEVCE
jgi:hypothetical protein